MIVKIVRGSETIWYNCESVKWVPRNISEDPKLSTAVLVIDMGKAGARMEEIECVHENIIYFMSDSGQTVDSFRW